MRKIAAFICLIAILSTSPALTVFADTTGDAMLDGDVNNDGFVSCKDIVCLSKKLLGVDDTDNNIRNGDINNDGSTNVLDMIYLKHMILGNTLISKVDVPVDIPISLYEGQKYLGNAKSFDTRNKYYNSSVYIQSYKQLLDFISSSSADGLNTTDLKDQYSEEFFETKSVVFVFNLDYNKNLVENAVFYNNTLTINVFECAEFNHNFSYVLYFPVVFDKDELKDYKINDIEYKANAKTISPDIFDLQSFKCCSQIEYINYHTKYLVNENEIVELFDWLDVSESDKEIILSKYNKEFFNNNELFIMCGEEITNMSVKADNKNLVFGLNTNQNDQMFSLLTIPKTFSDQSNITMIKWFCDGYSVI